MRHIPYNIDDIRISAKSMTYDLHKMRNTNEIPIVTRIKLGGVLYTFFQVVAPLHGHADGSKGFSDKCTKCTRSHNMLYEVVAITDAKLQQPSYRM